MVPWTVTHQAPLSMGFSRQKCWSGLPLPSPGYLPNPGIEPSSPDYRQTIYCLSHRGTQWIKFYLASIMSNQSSNTGVGCHFLLQGIFLTQGSSPASVASPALAGGSLPLEPPEKSGSSLGGHYSVDHTLSSLLFYCGNSFKGYSSLHSSGGVRTGI